MGGRSRVRVGAVAPFSELRYEYDYSRVHLQQY